MLFILKILLTWIALCFGMISFFMMYCAKTYLIKTVILILILLTLTAVIYESQFYGCGLYDCSLSRNQETIIPTKSFSCTESQRVNWRRAEILAFLVFIFLFLVNHDDLQKNLVVFVIVWFLLYFYFGFDQYHRSALACQSDQA